MLFIKDRDTDIAGVLPHPALSKGEGPKKERSSSPLSDTYQDGEDPIVIGLGEAKRKAFLTKRN